jgi:hypothetical protein
MFSDPEGGAIDRSSFPATFDTWMKMVFETEEHHIQVPVKSFEEKRNYE